MFIIVHCISRDKKVMIALTENKRTLKSNSQARAGTSCLASLKQALVNINAGWALLLRRCTSDAASAQGLSCIVKSV
jgi:hypothetical protein